MAQGCPYQRRHWYRVSGPIAYSRVAAPRRRCLPNSSVIWVELRYYQPVGRGTRVDMRLRLGTAKGQLRSQVLYYWGGLSTLRGYGFKQFSADRIGLLHAEYWIDGDAHWQHGAMPMEDMAMGRASIWALLGLPTMHKIHLIVWIILSANHGGSKKTWI